jgi:hypothetical protein
MDMPDMPPQFRVWRGAKFALTHVSVVFPRFIAAPVSPHLILTSRYKLAGRRLLVISRCILYHSFFAYPARLFLIDPLAKVAKVANICFAYTYILQHLSLSASHLSSIFLIPHTKWQLLMFNLRPPSQLLRFQTT